MFTLSINLLSVFSIVTFPLYQLETYVAKFINIKASNSFIRCFNIIVLVNMVQRFSQPLFANFNLFFWNSICPKIEILR